MSAGINIGGDLMKEAAEPLAWAIDRIFESGFRNHMEQGTIQAALNVLLRCSRIDNVTISNCNITTEK